MVRRSLIGVFLALGCGLAGCAGGGSDASHVSNDGVWSYTDDGTVHSRSDLAFLYVDSGCSIAKDDANHDFQLLGDPQKLVETDEYLGTGLYAVVPGSHTVKLHFISTADDRRIEAFPSKTADFRARHFYGFDCTRLENGDIHAELIDRDHIPDKGQGR